MEAERTTTELAPGMEAVVYAPDTLVITDKDGQEFAVTGRNNEETTAFLKAFDEWLLHKNKRDLSDTLMNALWSEVERTFRDIPLSIQREFVSFKLLGVTLPGTGHNHN